MLYLCNIIRTTTETSKESTFSILGLNYIFQFWFVVGRFIAMRSYERPALRVSTHNELRYYKLIL